MSLKSSYDTIAANPGPVVNIKPQVRTEVGVSDLPASGRGKTYARNNRDVDQYAPAQYEDGSKG